MSAVDSVEFPERYNDSVVDSLIAGMIVALFVLLAFNSAARMRFVSLATSFCFKSRQAVRAL